MKELAEQIPHFTEYLPTNNCVLLFWNTFIPNKDHQYRLYRKLSSEQNWSLLATLNNDTFSYADTTVICGISYDYQFRVVDVNGYFSRPSETVSVIPQAFSFTGELLVVDETRDGIGTQINPDDEMVDTVVAHEIMHIEFWRNFTIYCRDILKLNLEESVIFQEAATVLLNEEMGDILSRSDYGYTEHQEIRLKLVTEWQRNKNFRDLLKYYKELVRSK